MGSKVKNVSLALLALGLLVGNTDWGTGFVLWFAPKGMASWKVFVVIALVANLQACVWYLLGHQLVLVLGKAYLSAEKFFRGPNLSRVPERVSYYALAILKPFHEWDKTKKDMELLIRSVLKSKGRIVKTFLAWLFIPGSRSVTAIIFGMNSWRGGLWLLLFVNTLHVALGFGFWGLVFEGFQKLATFFRF